MPLEFNPRRVFVTILEISACPLIEDDEISTPPPVEKNKEQ